MPFLARDPIAIFSRRLRCSIAKPHPYQRKAVYVVFAIIVFLSMGCIDFLNSQFTAVLEWRGQRTNLREANNVHGIVVLGGSLRRSQHAVVLARINPKATIILSGPGRDEEEILTSDPSLVSRVIIDRRPRNTFENAHYSLSIARPMPGDRWIIVTSGIHMPRSIGSFRVAGFHVEPWPVLDDADHREAVPHRVLHEVLGLIQYRLLGRTDAFLP